MLSNITIYNLYNKLSNQTREKLILFETGKEISFGITGLFKNKKSGFRNDTKSIK